jgi:ribosome-associated heat shock protein Hsp15
MERLRIDKWLWAARFYKTRSLASEEIDKGRVEINGQAVKPAREVKVGDTVAMRREGVTRTVVVKGISLTRGPAGRQGNFPHARPGAGRATAL